MSPVSPRVPVQPAQLRLVLPSPPLSQRKDQLPGEELSMSDTGSKETKPPIVFRKYRNTQMTNKIERRYQQELNQSEIDSPGGNNRNIILRYLNESPARVTSFDKATERDNKRKKYSKFFLSLTIHSPKHPRQTEPFDKFSSSNSQALISLDSKPSQ
mmetsp:Transcript_20242/g.23410  ORF Transcript_20242/g.23410 Transcript_20242/m.23410 type:complete len:157 (-) Transcript_20242:11-481(-)